MLVRDSGSVNAVNATLDPDILRRDIANPSELPAILSATDPLNRVVGRNASSITQRHIYGALGLNIAEYQYADGSRNQAVFSSVSRTTSNRTGSEYRANTPIKSCKPSWSIGVTTVRTSPLEAPSYFYMAAIESNQPKNCTSSVLQKNGVGSGTTSCVVNSFALLETTKCSCQGEYSRSGGRVNRPCSHASRVARDTALPRQKRYAAKSSESWSLPAAGIAAVP